jgi:transcription antitermination factor NusG
MLENVMSENGNLEQVRGALQEITGIEYKPLVLAEAPDSYFVITRFGRERDAVDGLRRHGVSAEWPSYEHLEAKRERGTNRLVRRTRRTAVLPGYVFASTSLDIDFEMLLRRIVGAIDIARTDAGRPLFIVEADLVIIRKIAIGLNERCGEKVQHDFRVGERVRFVDDLVGRWPEGRIERLAPDGRIVVEVELMGRKVPITVLPRQIERTQASPGAGRRIPAQGPRRREN